MFAPLALLAFVVLAATLGPRLLGGAAWVYRAPGWGILAWQALTVSILAAITLIGLALAAPLLPLAELIARLCQTTPTEVIEHYQTPAGIWLAYAAAAGVAGLVGSLMWLAGSTVLNSARGRRAQLRLLHVLGREHPDGFVVVEHARPLVYCLPGLRHRVVVTSAALELLDPHELDLVLAHERSHLRSRHDVALVLADVLRRLFRSVRVFRVAHEQVATLIEMQADDAAHDPRGLAHALVTLGTGAPKTGLAAGDVAAVARVHRLAAGAGRWRRRQSIAVCLVTGALLAAPLALSLAPMIEMVLTDCATILG